VNTAAVDKDTMTDHSAARGVVGESEVEGSQRKDVVEGDTDRHIRFVFCRWDIKVWREVYYGCQASWCVVTVTASALEFTSSDLLVRQLDGESQMSPPQN